jgi:hypothetical protein
MNMFHEGFWLSVEVDKEVGCRSDLVCIVVLGGRNIDKIVE